MWNGHVLVTFLEHDTVHPILIPHVKFALAIILREMLKTFLEETWDNFEPRRPILGPSV